MRRKTKKETLDENRDVIIAMREAGEKFDDIRSYLGAVKGVEVSTNYVSRVFKDWLGEVPLSRRDMPFDEVPGYARKIIEEHARDGYSTGQIEGHLWCMRAVLKARHGEEFDPRRLDIGKYIREELELPVGKGYDAVPVTYSVFNGRKPPRGGRE